jgi:hypothetical protein
MGMYPAHVRVSFVWIQISRKVNSAMPFIPVPNVVQAELVYTWDGEICENVLHYEASGAPIVDHMIELGAWLKSWFDTMLQSNVANTLYLTNIKLTDLNSDIAPALDYSAGLPLQGGITDNSLPNNCALVFSKRTIFRGRSYRGRVYMAGLTESFVAGNSVITAARAPIQDAFDDLIVPVTTENSWNMVVVSRVHNGVDRLEGVATPVISMTTDWSIDSQRRRLPGRGS